MNERSVDLVKAYELISGGKLNKNGKSEINWFALKEEFINEERGNRRATTKRDLKKRLDRTLQALNTKPLPRNAEQLFKNYADLFFDRNMPKGGVGRKVSSPAEDLFKIRPAFSLSINPNSFVIIK